MSQQLAIVIPYYKLDFFRDALLSLKRQTDQRFTIYIGDDASPYNPLSVLDELNTDNWVADKIVYQKFAHNLGKNSLVKQWERCVALTQNENWIWLFSDDDVMEKNCVANFYSALAETNGQYNLYKFNTSVINAENKVIFALENPPAGKLDNFTLINQKISSQIYSLVVEYVFSRQTYQQTGGFVDFPLAWGSDDATWVKFSGATGIYIIKGANVLWRISEINISGNRWENRPLKLKALLLYCKWMLHYFKNHEEFGVLKANLFNYCLRETDNYASVITPALFLKIYFTFFNTPDFSFKRLLLFAYQKNISSVKWKLAQMHLIRSGS